MKELYKASMIILLLSLLTACKQEQSVEINTPAEVRTQTEKTPDIADVEFSDGLIGKLWHNYLQISFALSEADVDQVQNLGDSMVETFDAEMLVLKTLARQISETDDLELQRKLFAKFTDEAGPLFEKALSAGTIYKKRCPAATDDYAAFWYADVKDSPNPYSAEEVPECESIVEVFSKENE